VIPVCVLVLSSPKHPTQPPSRYFAIALPGYLLFVAAGMMGAGDFLRRRIGRWAGWIIPGLLLLLSLALAAPSLQRYYSRMPHADYRDVISAIERSGQEGDALVCLRAKEYALLDWYATAPLADGWHVLGVDFPWESRELAPGLTLGAYSARVGKGPTFKQWADSVEARATESLESIIEVSGQFRFLYGVSTWRMARGAPSIYDPTGLILEWLEDHYREKVVFEGDVYSLILYEMRREE
jgi:hypothetical protein